MNLHLSFLQITVELSYTNDKTENNFSKIPFHYLKSLPRMCIFHNKTYI